MKKITEHLVFTRIEFPEEGYAKVEAISPGMTKEEIFKTLRAQARKKGKIMGEKTIATDRITAHTIYVRFKT